MSSSLSIFKIKGFFTKNRNITRRINKMDFTDEGFLMEPYTLEFIIIYNPDSDDFGGDITSDYDNLETLSKESEVQVLNQLEKPDINSFLEKIECVSEATDTQLNELINILKSPDVIYADLLVKLWS